MASMLLSPVATGTLLYGLTRAPIRIRLPLIFLLRKYVEPENVDRLVKSNYRSERSKYNWSSEVAVVTGAAGGFGSLISKGLASKGIRVMAVDVQDELPAHMKASGRIHYFKCDITDRAAVLALAEEIRQTYGTPSILVNNAGILGSGRVLDLPEETIRKTFDVNIISHYWTVQAFLPAMIQAKKGHVVTIASMASFASSPGLGPYSSTKAGALSFHEHIRQETRLFSKAPEIQFTVVHPTYAATPMSTQFLDDLKKAKMQVITADVVADAVVKQVMTGRGRQIILRGNLGPVEYLRSLPHWFSTGVFMLLERFQEQPF